MKNPSEHNIALTDGDNTLWDWVSWGAVFYPEKAKILAGVGRINLRESEAIMKASHDRAGTMESPWSFEDIKRHGVFDKLGVNDEAEMKLKKDTRDLFYETRDKYLKIVPKIIDALEEMVERGWKVIMLTDAPLTQAVNRLSHFGIDKKIISKVIGAPDALKELTPKIHKSKDALSNYKNDIPAIETDVAKPFTELEKHLKMTAEEIRRRVVIIGDSDSKDMELARRYNCRGLHAMWAMPNREDIMKIKPFINGALITSEYPLTPDTGKIKVLNSPDQIIESLSLAA